ncbi:MAG: hypothetical protein IKX82_03640 [Bacilli bacterium]|jgi:hypothetical protein|nr:hypothetical protein [Bacilli bacterium]
MKKGTFLYRFFILLIAFVLIGVAVLLPLANNSTVEPLVLWIIGGVLLVAFIVTVVVNEIVRRKRKK